jgi:hypothetical protein
VVGGGDRCDDARQGRRWSAAVTPSKEEEVEAAQLLAEVEATI